MGENSGKEMENEPKLKCISAIWERAVQKLRGVDTGGKAEKVTMSNFEEITKV